MGIANSARGLVPLFSMSSSKGRNKNVLAHPPGGVFLSANFMADCLRQKIPAICPWTLRATQKPSESWPIRNSGSASLRMGHRGNLVAVLC